MLTTVPIYNQAAAIAETTIAAIQAEFPALEARSLNEGLHTGLGIQVRNPLNGDCWTTVAILGPHDRYDNQLIIYIGNTPYQPIAKFTSTIKAPIDHAIVARSAVEYITLQRAEQSKTIASQQARKASAEAAKQLNLKLIEAGLPTSGPETPFLYFGVNSDNNGNTRFSGIPSNVVAVTLETANAIVTPETAEKVLELWIEIGKLLLRTPSLRTPKDSCSSTGTLVN